MVKFQFFKKKSLTPVKIFLRFAFMFFMGVFAVKYTNDQTQIFKNLESNYLHKSEIINQLHEDMESTQFLLYKLYTHYVLFAVNTAQRDEYVSQIKKNLIKVEEDLLYLKKSEIHEEGSKILDDILSKKQEYAEAISSVLSIINDDVMMAYMYQNSANEIYKELNHGFSKFKSHFNEHLSHLLVLANENATKTVNLVIIFAISGVLLSFFVGTLRKDNYNLEKLVDERTAKLKENEQNLAITLNSIGDAIIATDTNGFITRMNPVAEKLTGWKFAEAEGLHLDEVFNIVKASGRIKAFNPVKKVLETGEGLNLENHTILVSKNGIEYQISDSAAPIKDENNNIKGVVLVFRDVTSDYLIQEKLISIKKAVESSGDAIGMATVSGDIFYQNQAFIDMLGYNHEELEAIKIPKLYKDQDKAYEMYSAVSNGRSWVGEIEIVKKDGSGLFVLLRADVIKNDAGELIGLVGVHTDITEQKKAQEQTIKMLEKEIAAREQQQNFVSMVSHEFKTPLSIIDSSAQKIVRKIDTIEISEIANRMERIRHNVGRLNTLVESTLSLSKLDSGKLSIKPSINDLKDVIFSTIRDIKNHTPDRIINFKHEGKTICNFDPERISLVVNNLLSNALKYSTQEINVLCFEDKDFVRFAVADKGVGISKEDLPKIGERFFRSKQTETVPGTGVGVYLMKNIIEKHRGYMTIESELNKGSTFIISIPKHFEQEGDNRDD